MAQDPKERFWNHVLKTENCWLWQASCFGSGYGQFKETHTKNRRAHRYAYEITKGPIPEGLTLDHLCRVKNCVNPEHLEPVTIEENQYRARAFVCKMGHKRREPPSRRCNICAREGAARRRARAKNKQETANAAQV